MVFDTGIETEFKDPTNPLIAKLNQARSEGHEIEVGYRAGNRANYQIRSITPTKVFTSSKIANVIYVRALSAGEEKLFRADKMAVFDPQKNPIFLEDFACSSCGNHDQPVEVDFERKRIRTPSACSSCGSSFQSETAPKTKKAKVASTENRPVCQTVGCKNLSEIKERVNGKARYRKTCSSCRKQTGSKQNQPNFTGTRAGAAEKNSNLRQAAMTSLEPSNFEKDESVDSGFMGARFKELREKLLDFSRRNPLVNFSHSERGTRFIRVVDEVPDELLATLLESSMQFKPLPEIGSEPPDEKTPEFQALLSQRRVDTPEYLQVIENDQLAESDALAYEQSVTAAERELRDGIRNELGLPALQTVHNPNLREHAKAHNFDPSYDLPLTSMGEAHEDAYIQTLMVPDDLDRRLRTIYQRYQDYYRETGINILQVAFGFVEWTEAKQSEKLNTSPLLLLPVTMTRRKTREGYAYEITAEGDNVEKNETLVEKLRSEFGIELPDLDDEIPLYEYFGLVLKALEAHQGWKVRAFVTLGLFPFQKISIFKDLFPEDWDVGSTAQNISSHDGIARLLGGKSSNETAFLESLQDIDSMTARGEAPPLIMEADSSQHSAIHEVFNGQSLVIQGPPGTGKSQTIANLIAAAVANRQRVLFVAEKKPALDVVATRLKSVGLGPLMLEPTSRGSKLEFLKSLEERLTIKSQYDEALYNKKKDDLIERIGFNEKIKNLLNKPTDYCSYTFFELCWRFIRFQHSISRSLRDAVSGSPVTSIRASSIEDFFELIERFIELQNNDAESIESVESFTNLLPNSISINEFIEDAKQLAQKLAKRPSSLGLLGKVGASQFAACSKLFAPKQSCGLHKQEVLESELHCLHQAANIDELISRVTAVCESISIVSDDELEAIDQAALAGRSRKLSELQSEATSLKQYYEKLSVVFSAFQLVNKGDVEFQVIRSAVTNMSVKSARVLSDLMLAELDFDDDRTTQRFEVLLDEIEGIESNLIKLSTSLSLDQLSNYTSEEVFAHADAIEGAGLFSIFSGRVNEAKQLMQALGLNPKSASDKRKLVELARLIQQSEQLSENKKYKKALGDKFEGVITDQDYISGVNKAIRELRLVANSLGAPLSTAVKLVSMRLDEDFCAALSNESVADGLTFKLKLEELSGLLERTNLAFQTLQKIGLADESEVFAGDLVDLLAKVSAAQPSIVLKPVYSSFMGALQELRNEKAALDSRGRTTQLSIAELEADLSFYEEVYKSSEEQIDRELAYELASNSELLGFCDDLVSACVPFATKFGVQDLTSLDDLLDVLGIVERVSGKDPSSILLSLSRSRFNTDCNQTVWPEFFELEELLEPTLSYDTVCDAFEYGIILNVLRTFASDNNLSLQELESGSIIRNRSSFRKIDNELKKLEADRALYIGTNDFGKIPIGNDTGPKKTWTDLKLINNELNKKKRHISIRSLILRARKALLTMKPVWLMDPISVSQFLPKSRELFDLVIIDEASQMLPESAIASIVRGKQLVVVGDDMQMPPSQHFGSTLELDEEEQQVDAESILDLASKRLGNTISLRWHYRSRHESLINFSNKYFYEDRLEVFPSPRHLGGPLGVKRVEVQGSYRSGVNVPEAKAVIVQLKQCMSEYPEESIGVVAMNAKQQDYINEQLNMLKDTDKVVAEYFDRWEQDPLNTLFVKNLENVQGDERDTIIISSVYGRDQDGNMFQRFPLINTATGHRRLNVLFTRAKNRVILVTSLKASDVKLDENSHRGKKALRDYIEYAGTGRLEVGEIEAAAQADSDFEIHVMQRLAQAGYKPVPQVGVKGFKIDIGVGHPDYSDGFIAGVECDGATYHSSPQARDRDKIRQDILQSLGWKIYRIWSTDWFANPDKETEKMLDWLSSAWCPDRKVKQTEGVSDRESEKLELVDEPAGTQRSVTFNDQIITYYSVDSEVFEVWNDGVYNGWVERERENRIEQASYGLAMNEIKGANFIATAIDRSGVEQEKSFNSVEPAVIWVYTKFIEAKSNDSL